MPFGRLLKHGRCPCFLRDVKPIQTNKQTNFSGHWIINIELLSSDQSFFELMRLGLNLAAIQESE
ncbi:hypothetical protein I7I48_10582 [Histoplasma ohiense]|nr:hypothetical protein I7I48_10582 [Histoplasma ohiense (nom. inval.)]